MAANMRALSILGDWTIRRNRMAAYLAITTVVVITFLVYTPLPSAYGFRRDSVEFQVAGATSGSVEPELSSATSLESTTSKYAFATLLVSDASRPDDQENLRDQYFIATRLLGYQILHALETRSENIPFIVLVTTGVSQGKRERLLRDGAIVVAVESIETPSWFEALPRNWEEVLDKLHIWEFTQFDRICFLDSDTVLNRPLDGIFQDPAVALHKTLNHPDKLKPDEGPLPASYVFAGQPEMKEEHHYPPSDEKHDYPNKNYLNAGFFVVQPSLEILEHYFRIMAIPNRFRSEFPEQNLFNYAHRREEEGGSMPWRSVDTAWNIHSPTLADLKGGVASLHEKWWAPINDELAPYLQSWRWRMEGFYEALDAITK